MTLHWRCRPRIQGQGHSEPMKSMQFSKFCRVILGLGSPRLLTFGSEFLQHQNLEFVPRPVLGFGGAGQRPSSHTGRRSKNACKVACKPFDVVCKVCKHSH